MSFGGGQKRPGGESGALMHVKRPRQDLVAASNDVRGKQLMQSVSVSTLGATGTQVTRTRYEFC